MAALLSVPAYAGAWGAKGSLEPDTALDRNGGYMWLTPDTTNTGPTGHKIYFNGFVTQNADPHFDHGVSTLNPNFASVGSARQAWMGQPAALLGVWKDCNKDGYIGLGDNGLFEYRAELLLGDTSVCPKSVPPSPIPLGWTPVHNDGVWIHEFLPLGYHVSSAAASPHVDANKWDLNDDGARVWMDWNKPGDKPAATRCYIFAPQGPDPQGHPQWGTYHSTGGMLAYADCWDDEIVTTAIDTAATGPLSLLSFADHPRDQWNSSSALNQGNPWGDPGGRSDVTIFDCNQPQVMHVNLPVQSSGVGVSRPKVPPSVSTTGSVGGTANETATALDDCDRSNNQQGSNLQTEGQVAAAPYSAETGGLLFSPDSKISTDYVLQYNEGARPPVTSAVVGPSGAKDAGLSDAANTDGLWLATGTISEDHNPYVNRAALQTKPIQEVQYITTYAYISPAGVSAYGLELNPGGKTGTYGQEACGGYSSGVHNGWNCDPNAWWPGTACDPNAGYGCTGTIEGQVTPVNVRLGQEYNERDVDCYDSSVSAARNAGVGYGILTGTSCV